MAEQGQAVPSRLLITRYNPERVEQAEMMSVQDIEEILAIPLVGVVPESEAVLKASNQGIPVVHDQESDAGQAYSDMTARFLGEEREMRFTEIEKKGFFSRMFGGRR